MTRLVPVAINTHAQKVWRRPANYQFAAQQAVTSLILAEAGQMGSWMPITFIEQGGRFVPMAMMSPVPEQNLFIGPDGQWLGGRVPTSLRSYPFRLVATQDNEQLALCIDEDSGLIADADENGEAFFTADGQPSQSMTGLMEFLRQVEANRMTTDLAMASLAEAGVIEPWPLELDVDGKKTALGGLHRINETALNGLDDEAFLKLRKTSGLPLAYAQLMSMPQIVRFEQLMRLRLTLAQTPKIRPEQLFKVEQTDLIRFD